MTLSKTQAKIASNIARPDDTGFEVVKGKLSNALCLQWQMQNPGKVLPIPSEVRKFDLQRVKVPAGINRHTGKPHEHRREIARRLAA